MLSKCASELFMFSFSEEGISFSHPKRISQGNHSVPPNHISTGVRPVTDLPYSVLGPFQALQILHLHHFFHVGTKSVPLKLLPGLSYSFYDSKMSSTFIVTSLSQNSLNSALQEN
ncbi:hypothetical protein AVEN_263371-1 [Araneus ventricosus]|uniref:Uncharacterized protein n=1 Tax=Araneus ventricosus TaxID=182803 RepID=A0A4Y2D1C7_ARAVE|nr:hypothetical protein AVEN_263371-1 [Araneus ventricosus]